MSLAIVLLSYQRPLMTERAIHRLLELVSDVPVLVSVDRPQEGAATSVREIVGQTYEVARAAAAGGGGIHVRQPQVRNGIAGHAFDALRDAQLRYGASRFVLLEEDQILEREGLHFLEEQLDKAKTHPMVVSAYTSQDHTGVVGPRLTPFPQLWGVGLNALTLDRAQQLHEGRTRISFSQVWRALAKFRTPRRLAYPTTYYLYRTLRIAQASPNHFDGLLHAVCVLSRGSGVVPSRSLLKDIGGGEDAYSYRMPSELSPHRRCWYMDPHSQVCLACETATQKSITLSLRRRILPGALALS